MFYIQTSSSGDPHRDRLLQSQKQWHSGQNGDVLSEVLVTVGIEDSVPRVGDGQILAASLTSSVVTGAAVGGEVRRRLNEHPGPGIGTGVRNNPEETAEVDGSKLEWN